jgi:hypothetical protein
MSQSLLRNTHQEAVVKVWGTAGTTETISLAGLVSVNQALDGATQTANIVGVTWTGQNATEITVARGGVTVMTLPSTGSATIDFGGQALPPESTNNTANIVVTIAGGVGEVWIKLRKVSGYKATSGEYQQHGAYEDESRVGASTVVNGSPDYIAP